MNLTTRIPLHRALTLRPLILGMEPVAFIALVGGGVAPLYVRTTPWTFLWCLAAFLVGVPWARRQAKKDPYSIEVLLRAAFESSRFSAYRSL